MARRRFQTGEIKYNYRRTRSRRTAGNDGNNSIAAATVMLKVITMISSLLIIEVEAELAKCHRVSGRKG